MLLIGIYAGIMYAICISSYLDHSFEDRDPIDVCDVIFILLSPITVPLFLISSLINPNQDK